jgi:hypothetical protein
MASSGRNVQSCVPVLVAGVSWDTHVQQSCDQLRHVFTGSRHGNMQVGVPMGILCMIINIK